MEFSHLENWIDQINSGNLEQVVGLYSQDALLFATFDEKPLNTPALIRGYFDSFLARDGAGVELDSASVCHSELGERIIIPLLGFTHFFLMKVINTFDKKLDLLLSLNGKRRVQ